MVNPEPRTFTDKDWEEPAAESTSPEDGLTEEPRNEPEMDLTEESEPKDTPAPSPEELDAPEEEKQVPEEQFSEEEENSPTSSPEESSPNDARVREMEERIHRLENVLANLQHVPTSAAPETPPSAPGATEPDKPNFVQRAIATGKGLLPFVGSMKPPKQLPPSETLSSRRTWLFFEVYAEWRAIIRMHLDPRYRFGFQARYLPPLFILLIVLVGFFMPNALGIGTVLEYVIQVVLLYLLFKVWNREANHYRKTSPDLPASLRL